MILFNLESTGTVAYCLDQMFYNCLFCPYQCLYLKTLKCTVPISSDRPSRIFTLYSKSLPLDLACRVWDVFCRDGEEFLFRTALGLLRLYQEVLTCMDFIHMAQFLTRLPDLIPADQLFQHIAAVHMTSRNRKWAQVGRLLRIRLFCCTLKNKQTNTFSVSFRSCWPCRKIQSEGAQCWSAELKLEGNTNGLLLLQVLLERHCTPVRLSRPDVHLGSVRGLICSLLQWWTSLSSSTSLLWPEAEPRRRSVREESGGLGCEKENEALLFSTFHPLSRCQAVN